MTESRGILSARCGRQWARKVEAPGVVADGGEHVEEGRARLGPVPRTNQPVGGVPLLDAGGVPEQDQIIDEAGHWSRAGDGGGGLVLRVLKAEELLLIV